MRSLQFARTQTIPQAQRALDECRSEVDKRRHEILELGKRRRILAETVRSSEDDQVIIDGNAELEQIILLLNSKEAAIQKHETSLGYAEDALEKSERQVKYCQSQAEHAKNRIALVEKQIADLELEIGIRRDQIAGLNDELTQYIDEGRRISGG